MVYAGVAAATKAGQYMHLILKDLNQMIFAGLQEDFGLAATDPDWLVERITAKLKTVLPDLPDDAVELIRVDVL